MIQLVLYFDKVKKVQKHFRKKWKSVVQLKKQISDIFLLLVAVFSKKIDKGY